MAKGKLHYLNHRLLNYTKALEFIDLAYQKAKQFTDSAHAGHHANLFKIRIYYAKLLINKGDYKQAELLLLDNLKSAQCEMLILDSKSNGPVVAHPSKKVKYVKHILTLR